MKKFLAALLAAMLLPLGAVAETIVTSFYPIYIFALNLTEDIEGVEVRNLTAPDTGCLHDYQLQTGDMKKLAAADAFLINGAGMEGYLSGVMDAFPQLMVVDASTGIELLCAEEEHDHEHDHDHGEYNAHVWLDAENAQTMVRNLAEGLMTACPDQAETIAANRDAYIARLEALDAELTAALADLPRKDIVTFHEAFPYFAKAYGLNVAAVVNPGQAGGAGEAGARPGGSAPVCGTTVRGHGGPDPGPGDRREALYAGSCCDRPGGKCSPDLLRRRDARQCAGAQGCADRRIRRET